MDSKELEPSVECPMRSSMTVFGSLPAHLVPVLMRRSFLERSSQLGSTLLPRGRPPPHFITNAIPGSLLTSCLDSTETGRPAAPGRHKYGWIAQPLRSP
jgi:hypothetical protein